VSVRGRARVLIADDHRALLERVGAVLAGEFDVVGTVQDGAALVAAEAILCPDVMVVDIGMPGLNGLEAVARIRARGSQVPFVCLTTCPDADMGEAARQAGALGYVHKSALAGDLVPAVQAALAGRRFP